MLEAATAVSMLHRRSLEVLIANEDQRLPPSPGIVSAPACKRTGVTQS